MLLGVRFRAPARRPAPGGGRGLRLRAARPPSGFKRLHASERQHLRKRRKSFRIPPANNPPNGHATAAHARAAHRATAPSNRTSSRLPHRGTARRSDAPPRAPRTPVPETARARRAACQGRTGAVAAGRVSGASGRSATLCVCRPRRGERLRRRARGTRGGARAAGSAAVHARRPRVAVSYFQPARALGDFRVGYHTA